MAKKKLLIFAHYYAPDTASTGQILKDQAEGMLDEFDVTVICVVPSYGGTIEDSFFFCVKAGLLLWKYRKR